MARLASSAAPSSPSELVVPTNVPSPEGPSPPEETATVTVEAIMSSGLPDSAVLRSPSLPPVPTDVPSPQELPVLARSAVYSALGSSAMASVESPSEMPVPTELPSPVDATVEVPTADAEAGTLLSGRQRCCCLSDQPRWAPLRWRPRRWSPLQRCRCPHRCRPRRCSPPLAWKHPRLRCRAALASSAQAFPTRRSHARPRCRCPHRCRPRRCCPPLAWKHPRLRCRAALASSAQAGVCPTPLFAFGPCLPDSAVSRSPSMPPVPTDVPSPQEVPVLAMSAGARACALLPVYSAMASSAVESPSEMPARWPSGSKKAGGMMIQKDIDGASLAVPTELPTSPVDATLEAQTVR
ncbi:unnamed protein product [Effrenium voratum]|nr:unnamed protein product [Effrenium voratum]